MEANMFWSLAYFFGVLPQLLESCVIPQSSASNLRVLPQILESCLELWNLVSNIGVLSHMLESRLNFGKSYFSFDMYMYIYIHC